jgi:hypothetical protein
MFAFEMHVPLKLLPEDFRAIFTGTLILLEAKFCGAMRPDRAAFFPLPSFVGDPGSPQTFH